MTITRTITVAAGRFAPGHLGELTAIVPFEPCPSRPGQPRAGSLTDNVHDNPGSSDE
ncbi:hypothetical protein ACFY20_45475 [Streptomyces sp. NPDC001312]|uniref:hypothetical protein n=1 Tax=Streptomyces sp. NPDC001312 TaxID=3364561 RepID=UPI0036A10F88